MKRNPLAKVFENINFFKNDIENYMSVKIMFILHLYRIFHR